MRCFFAIPVPSEISADLYALRQGHAKVRWHEVEMYHLTLAFLGDVSLPDLEELDQEVANLRFGSLDLGLSRVDTFNDSRTARAFVALFEDNSALNELQKRLRQLCLDVLPDLGKDLSKRKFKPHVTLASCKGLYLDEAAEIQARMGQTGVAGIARAKWTADGFELWQSHTTKTGAAYDTVAAYPSVDAVFAD